MPILCADIGTSSLKTALVDLQGRVLSQYRHSFPKATCSHEEPCSPDFGENPCCTQKLFDGEHWLQALVEASINLRKQSPDAVVEGICISGNGPTLATEQGEIFLWNHPVPAALADEVQHCLAQHKLFSIFLPRLLLFQRLFPQQWAEAATIFSGPEYLIWRLTGTRLTILPEKRFQAAYWSEESLGALEIEGKKLPGFVELGTTAGPLLPAMAEKLGLPEETPVFCGGPDFTVALIGTNTLEPGKLCDRAGSSEGINLCLAENPAQALREAGIEGIRVLPSVVPGLFNASVLIPDSGTRFSTLKKEVAPRMSYQEFVEALLQEPPLSQAGLQLMEELAVEVREAYQKLSAVARLTGTRLPPYISTTGGQAKNPRWLQFKSAIVGTGFSITTCADAELVGDAVLAYCGLGRFNSIQEGAERLVRIHQTFFPDRD